MQAQISLMLDAKILKHVKETCEAQQIAARVEPKLVPHYGLQLTDLRKKMWYFMRKNTISDEQIWRNLKGLERQGFLEIALKNNTVLVRQPIKSEPVEQDLVSIDMQYRRGKPKLTAQQIHDAEIIAERYKAERAREKALGINALGTKSITDAPSDQEISDDQATLEEYLKDE